MDKYGESEGVWRTVGGRRIFIKMGQSLDDAMRESGKFPRKKDSELTEDEIYAINKYIGAESYELNEKLRDGTQLTPEEQEWVDNLDAALGKVPRYSGITYRSIDIDDADAFMENCKVGTEIKFPAYTSTSTETYDAVFSIQYVITGSNGFDIRKFNAKEGEILFGRNASFKVDKIERYAFRGINGYTIFVEEL